MNTIIRNSENSKASDRHELLLNLQDKINFKKAINMLLYQIVAYNIHGKLLKSHTNTTKLKYQFPHGMNNLNYLIAHVLYQTLKTIMSISAKSHGEKTNNF